MMHHTMHSQLKTKVRCGVCILGPVLMCGNSFTNVEFQRLLATDTDDVDVILYVVSWKNI